MSDKDELVIVFYGSVIQADFLKSALEMNGVTAFLQDQAMGILAPWYVEPGGTGAVKVTVPKGELEKARPVVQKFLKRRTAK